MTSLCKVNISSKCHKMAVVLQDEQQDSHSPGVTEYHFKFKTSPESLSGLERPNLPPLEDRPFICLHIANRALGIAGVWRPDSGFCRNLNGDWSGSFLTNISHSAPVLCFFNYEGINRLTLSISEVNRDVWFNSGIHEETGEIFTDILIYLPEDCVFYQLCLRTDQRPLRFDSAVRAVASWWDRILDEAPPAAPAEAIAPMYSTWYSYHQDMTEDALLTECKTASELGMKTIIIDDGWQTSDNSRGYGYCGDWKAEPSKFPDFKSFVEKIHALGMKCMLWYSVPFIGKYSHMWEQFEHRLLHYDPVLHTGILDPRYPQVRRYLISIYRDAEELWNLDGFKLDFIDSFRAYPDTPPCNSEMDFAEIQDAVYRLMLDIRYTLEKSNPDLLLEFRQNYIGPQMRRFGNFFRVSDCPLSGITNRVGITDLKLLCASSAVHSDMILWNEAEAPEDIAIQLINCIFATMQVSVRLNQLTKKQRDVLRHYLAFSVRYRSVLLGGNFKASSPLSLYPLLTASSDGLQISAVYDAKRCIDFSDDHPVEELWILNGTHYTELYLKLPQDSHYAAAAYDCSGIRLSETLMDTDSSAVYTLFAPAGGSVNLKKR